ncbi:unnamed protein product, partial [marine sediment metagenome]
SAKEYLIKNAKLSIEEFIESLSEDAKNNQYDERIQNDLKSVIKSKENYVKEINEKGCFYLLSSIGFRIFEHTI